jgi:hypothetical protein
MSCALDGVKVDWVAFGQFIVKGDETVWLVK